MFLQIILIACGMAALQYLLYQRKAHKLTLYLLPITCLSYTIYIIFQVVREQAVVTTSLPLWIRILFPLVPLCLALIFMILCIVIRYRNMKNRGSIRGIVLRQFFGFLCVLFVLLSITIYTAQEYVIFYPNKDDQATQTLLGDTSFERVSLQDSYSGWLRENKNSDTIIVYFGGNAQNTSSTFLTFEETGIFSTLQNTSFLSIDYPTYGDSTGSLSQESLFTMADTVLAYVHERFPNHRIVIIGYSIGTGIASYTASQQEPDAFVLIAPYNNGKDLFNSYFPIFYGPLQKLIHYPLTSDQYVSKLTCPTLILMAAQDSIVPARLARKLMRAFPVEPDSITYEQIDHGSIILDQTTWSDIAMFLQSK